MNQTQNMWTTNTNKFATLDVGEPTKGKFGSNRSNSIGNPMSLTLVAGGIIQNADALERPLHYSRGGEYVPLDLKETYSSFNSAQPVKGRSTGFVDFQFQTLRP